MAETIGTSRWRQHVATVIVLAYGYQLVAWPLFFWLSVIAGWPAPPLLPWEHLAVGTGTLASILSIDIVRDKFVPPENAPSQSRAQRL